MITATERLAAKDTWEFQEGVDAAKGGRSLSANPYPMRSFQHLAWVLGWSFYFNIDG